MTRIVLAHMILDELFRVLDELGADGRIERVGWGVVGRGGSHVRGINVDLRDVAGVVVG